MHASAPLPKYLAVSERLIRDIAAGHLADGARLPGERDMARDLGLSVGTLRKALAVLEEAGLLDRVQGSGNYVRHRAGVASVYGLFRLEKPGGGGLPTATVLDVGRHAKPADAPRFGAAPDGWRIRRLRHLDDVPVAVEEIWLDGDRAESLTMRDLSDSLYRVYRERFDLVIAAVEDRLGLRAVPAWAPAEFVPPAGQKAAHITRLSRDTDGQAAEFSRTWFDHDRARYVSRMGKG
ncbi:transcriptional regulator, GntR family [Loktanella fryxellensis]|uniref:Transcriptional regulator, GntR family n=1 Tax=Loktanella fryxellensis TaxID=245187 RepID=A0A1H8BQC6_9RHOB|nr:GntR family transcriptional regulator [Loktanella fryxellensis]SEM85081.1 transcriptional regulator, GntR family [Loktanella fryxellensis]